MNSLPSFPPLFPPLFWWKLYMSACLGGAGDAEAIAAANAACGMKPRGWMRFDIAGPATLSLPVGGGASALKNRPAASWALAREAQGRWRGIGATLATVYGRTPFFGEVSARIGTLGPLMAEGTGAGEICRGAFEVVAGLLDVGDLLPDLGKLIAVSDSRLAAVCRETGGRVTPSLSVLDALFRVGRDAIFTLVPTFYLNSKL